MRSSVRVRSSLIKHVIRVNLLIKELVDNKVSNELSLNLSVQNLGVLTTQRRLFCVGICCNIDNRGLGCIGESSLGNATAALLCKEDF